jgi:multicomponent Na+:H+ antiporter subunit E
VTAPRATPPAAPPPPAPPQPVDPPGPRAGGADERRAPATTVFAGNLLLALAWVAMSGTFSVPNFAVGFVLGYGVLFAARRAIGGTSYFGKTRGAIGFVLFYAREVILANLRVAYDVVTPTHHMHPGIVAVPLDARTDVEITLLANLITMTPGTLSMDVSDDRSVLYVHGMFVGDPDEFAATVKHDFERRVLELLR